MTQNSFEIRRATIEDLEVLCSIGRTLFIDPTFIERHLTDFQVAVGPDASIVGAVALELSGLHGRIHSEAFYDFSVAETVREIIWERLQSISRSRGLTRLWTQETAPFWNHNGFLTVSNQEMATMPVEWSGYKGNWLGLKLRDEELLRKALDKDFVRLKEEEERTTPNSLGSIKTMLNAAVVFSVVVALIAIAFCILLLRTFPSLLERFHR